MSIGTPLLICGAVDNIDFARYYSSSWLGFCFFLFYLFGLFLVSTCSCDPVQTRYKFSSWLWPKLHYGDLLWICWTTSRGRTCATQHLGMSRCSRVIADLRLSTCTCCTACCTESCTTSSTTNQNKWNLGLYTQNSKLSYFSNPTLHRHLAPLRTAFTDTRTASRLFLCFSFFLVFSYRYFLPF